jgi:hypothetical protein
MDGWCLLHCSSETLVLHLAKQIIFSSPTKPQIHPKCRLKFNSLRNIACCVAMNDEEEVTIFEAMIQ